MPTLRGIKCTIEIGPGNLPLKEYKAKYDDGYVQTFLAVPDSGVNFTVHIETEGYIAPGLAFFVFMDGEYQCNRNRIGLKLPGYGVDPSEYETAFRMRQKEEKNAYGSFVASDWSFKALDRGEQKFPLCFIFRLTSCSFCRQGTEPQLTIPQQHRHHRDCRTALQAF